MRRWHRRCSMASRCRLARCRTTPLAGCTPRRLRHACKSRPAALRQTLGCATRSLRSSQGPVPVGPLQTVMLVYLGTMECARDLHKCLLLVYLLSLTWVSFTLFWLGLLGSYVAGFCNIQRWFDAELGGRIAGRLRGLQLGFRRAPGRAAGQLGVVWVPQLPWQQRPAQQPAPRGRCSHCRGAHLLNLNFFIIPWSCWRCPGARSGLPCSSACGCDPPIAEADTVELLSVDCQLRCDMTAGDALSSSCCCAGLRWYCGDDSCQNTRRMQVKMPIFLVVGICSGAHKGMSAWQQASAPLARAAVASVRPSTPTSAAAAPASSAP